MREMFDSEDMEVVLLADSSNAFNTPNQRSVLHNMKFICPALAKVLLTHTKSL